MIPGSPIVTRARGRPAPLLLLRQQFRSSMFPPFAVTGCVRKVTSTSVDPRTRREALADDAEGWTKAERKELTNHSSNQSWVYKSRDDIPAGRKLVRLIWVYKRKRDGSLKARLCVQGCSQIPGVDYDQTFCGTLRGTSLRGLFAIE